ncbi:MAG: DNA cytosine methyltransferase [Planctomycetota bacterium]
MGTPLRRPTASTENRRGARMICRAPRPTATFRPDLFDGLIIDNFAGGGGAGKGIEQALSRPVDHAINHDADALAMHRVNHPGTTHWHEDVWEIDPRKVTGGRAVDLAWFSPDCKHFSKAKGGRPVSPRVRGLAWVVIRWAELVRPRVIMLENVEEFQTWGPLTPEQQPCPERKGQTFRGWVRKLRDRGYDVQWRELRACDYGAPTIRKRLFLVARCDGRPIVWPEATHGVAGSRVRSSTATSMSARTSMDKTGSETWQSAPRCHGRPAGCAGQNQRSPLGQNVASGPRPHLLPYRTAADCIDFDRPVCSIFATQEEANAWAEQHGVRPPKRPLAENTLRRIAAGVKRYVLDDPEPFIVAYHSPKSQGDHRLHSCDNPLPTQTTENRFGLCVPTLVQTGYGERQGQAPRVPGLGKPLGTVVAGGSKHALVAAFLNRLGQTGGNGDYVNTPQSPVTTITTKAEHCLTAVHLLNQKGTQQASRRVNDPLSTVCAGAAHACLVAALLVKFYGTATAAPLDEPLHAVTTKHRFGLVTVEIDGETYIVTDIGMRMLQPRELYRAQGFGDDYVIDRGIDADGRPVRLTKTAQVRACGNSVCPDVAEALLRANVM